MKVKGCQFIEAKRMIDELLPMTTVELPKARRDRNFDSLTSIWQRAQHLTGEEPASWYLARRGLTFDKPPACIRFLPSFTYYHDDKSRTDHPAMLSLFVSPDRTEHTIQYTYLDGAGHKAEVPKPRKLAPAKVPRGGAVRLAPSAETMGIAEGVETALAASKLFGVPVWAALNAGQMIQWEPPATARCIIVFGDNDSNATGQAAAWALTHRLITEGLQGEARIPDLADTDWNDVLLSENGQ